MNILHYRQVVELVSRTSASRPSWDAVPSHFFGLSANLGQRWRRSGVVKIKEIYNFLQSRGHPLCAGPNYWTPGQFPKIMKSQRVGYVRAAVDPRLGRWLAMPRGWWVASRAVKLVRTSPMSGSDVAFPGVPELFYITKREWSWVNIHYSIDLQVSSRAMDSIYANRLSSQPMIRFMKWIKESC